MRWAARWSCVELYSEHYRAASRNGLTITRRAVELGTSAYARRCAMRCTVGGLAGVGLHAVPHAATAASRLGVGVG